MATQPTNLPVPSETPRDLKFNAGKIDEFVTSDSHSYTDRFGVKHRTIFGINYDATQAILNYGYIPVDSFQSGATLTIPNQVLRWKLPDGDGDYYRWDGDFGATGKIVPPDSTPNTAGGVGKGKWLSVGDAALRADLLHRPLTMRNGNLALADYPTINDYSGDLARAISEAKTGGFVVEIFSNTTIKVPTHVATMQDAVTLVKAEKNVAVTVLIEAGHVLTAPLVLSGGDYGNFTISSEDTNVKVSAGALVPFSDRTTWCPVFGADNGCHFPVVDVLVDLTTYTDGAGTRNGSGIVSLRGSNVFVKPGKGCIAGYQGAIAYDAAIINCPDAIFTHAIEAGLTSWSSSKVYADRVDVSNSEKYGLRSTEGASLTAKFSKATHCGRHAARAVSAAFLDVSDSDLSYSATNAVYARHACVVNANNSNLSNSGSLPVAAGEVNAGVYALRGSLVSAIQCTVDNSVAGFIADSGSVIACAVSSVKTCTDAFIALRGSTIDGDTCNATGSTNVAQIDGASRAILTGLICPSPVTGIRVLDGSNVDCRNASITGCAGPAVSAFSAATVCADGATFTGCVANAVYAIGSYVSAKNANCSGSNRGFVAEDGGVISAKGGIANTCVDGVYAISGGRVSFAGGTATTCTRGIRSDGGVVDAAGANLTGATSAGVFAEKGSEINLNAANCRKGVTDANTDIQCFTGSIIKAATATGGVNIAKNTPSSGGLIIG
ncbi:hypothetical protein MXM41_04215 [Leclercia adecarboxylata]|uniref:tail fiber/spike domain-containing protein n=1 Tax=Leclercia adecarboxylata TaxID=83655 RepID=UPI002DB55E46|nr:hypothetical protein [Leclercia adecarboxylata]MEB6378145.1 hypothetical protein [Leclercia adecarboxylata]